MAAAKPGDADIPSSWLAFQVGLWVKDMKCPVYIYIDFWDFLDASMLEMGYSPLILGTE